MSEQRLKIGITQGDTNGIGWEVIIKTFSDPRMAELCTPIIYGSPKAAAHYRTAVQGAEEFAFTTIATAAEARKGKVNLIATGAEELLVEPGKPSAEAGLAAADALRAAATDLKSGELDALVTAPIDKETIHSEEFPYTGHTEFLAAQLGGQPLMLMCSERLRVGLVTIHIPVAEVSANLSQPIILQRIDAMRATLKRDFGIVEPRIAVLALNPHAGDGGLLGGEEAEIIRPAIVEAFKRGVLAFGPFAADGLFASGAYTNYDGVLAMYHDQGLTPFKTLSPDGVNYTASLDAVRTSPDHGVAYDIAGQNRADAQSMRNAVYAAIDIVRRRRAWDEWTRNPLQPFTSERSNGRDISVKELPDTQKED